MHNSRTRLILIPLMYWVGISAISERGADVAEQVRVRLEALRVETGFPGISAAVTARGGSQFVVAVGLADLDSGRRLKPDDRMLAGSVGKTFFAALALQLVEKGKVKLDDSAGKWLGRELWYMRLPNAESLTIRHLMRHTSGIPEHVMDRKFLEAIKENPKRVWKPAELLGFVLDKPALFPVGEGWSYADTNYIVLGMILERACGRSLYQEVQRRFIKPLKLTRTIPSDSAQLPGLITGYARAANPFGASGAVMNNGELLVNPQFEWAGGGFASTPRDLARWALALYGGKVLKSESLAVALDSVPARTGRGDRYGLGVQVRQSPWGETYGHGGWYPGYLSETEYFSHKETAISVQFNTDDLSKLKRSPRAYIAEIARIVFGEPSRSSD